MSVDPTEAVTAMDCTEFERSLDAYLDDELAELEQAEAADHLVSCEACRALADRQSRIRSALRAQLKAIMGPGTDHGRAPEALRDRIHSMLASERRSPWRRLVSPVPIAAVAACAAGVLVVLATHQTTDPLIDEAVTKHTRDLPLEVTAASIGPESLADWFAGKLDFNAAPPRFLSSGVHLVGARLSHIQDHPAAYVRYDSPHGHMGLFIVDDPEGRYGDVGRTLQIGPSTVRLINARGFNVAVWRRNEIVYSLVSDLGERDLTRLVEAAQAAGP